MLLDETTGNDAIYKTLTATNGKNGMIKTEMKPPVLIPVDMIDRHPRNPRGEITEDSVATIANRMGDRYLAVHAVRVRVVGGRYQLIGGHRRIVAAKSKGMKEVYAWIEEMSDEDAFMELVRDNDHDDIDPIYIGIHAYYACDLSKGGKGISGGIREYARLVGRDDSGVSKLRAAGEVISKCGRASAVTQGISRQLYEISRMPEKCWSKAVDWLVGITDKQRKDKHGTIRDVSERVASCMAMDVPKEHKGTDVEWIGRLEVFMGKSWKWPVQIASTESDGQDKSSPSVSVGNASTTTTKPKANPSGGKSKPEVGNTTSANESSAVSVESESPPIEIPASVGDVKVTEEKEDGTVSSVIGTSDAYEFLGVEPLTNADCSDFTKRLAVSDTKYHSQMIATLIETYEEPIHPLPSKTAKKLAALIAACNVRTHENLIDVLLPKLRDTKKAKVISALSKDACDKVLVAIRTSAMNHFGQAKINLVDKPLSLAEVIQHANNMRAEGRRDDAPKHATAFYEHFSSKGWMIDKNTPVLNWRDRLLVYCRMVGGETTENRRVEGPARVKTETIADRKRIIAEENKRKLKENGVAN